MGNIESGLDKGIQQQIISEFERVRKDDTRDYLVLGELLQIQSPEDFPFTFNHIGNLFVLDSNKDGRVTLDELCEFGLVCVQHLKNYKTYEFQSQLQSFSTLQLWHAIKTADGENDIIAWIGRLLYENEDPSYFENIASKNEEKLHCK